MTPVASTFRRGVGRTGLSARGAKAGRRGERIVGCGSVASVDPNPRSLREEVSATAKKGRRYRCLAIRLTSY